MKNKDMDEQSAKDEMDDGSISANYADDHVFGSIKLSMPYPHPNEWVDVALMDGTVYAIHKGSLRADPFYGMRNISDTEQALYELMNNPFVLEVEEI